MRFAKQPTTNMNASCVKALPARRVAATAAATHRKPCIPSCSRCARATATAVPGRRTMTVKAVAGLLPPEYGYVIASAGVTAAVLQWQAINVALARRKYGVQYPAMYAAGDGDDARVFNCTQRAHQNTLETAPAMTIMMALLGLVYPLPAAAAQAVWAAGRVAYAVGYSTGDPNKRLPGVAVSGLAYVGAIAAAIAVGLRMALAS